MIYCALFSLVPDLLDDVKHYSLHNLHVSSAENTVHRLRHGIGAPRLLAARTRMRSKCGSRYAAGSGTSKTDLPGPATVPPATSVECQHSGTASETENTRCCRKRFTSFLQGFTLVELSEIAAEVSKPKEGPSLLRV